MYQQLPRPTIFAHRGSSAYAPENTLAAFELAVSQNADAIELDAKLCADGEIVIIHDQTLERTTDGRGKVADYPNEALRELDAGSWFGAEYRGEKIPTLREVLETVGRKTFTNIELTNYASLRDELPDKVVDLVKQLGLETHVLFSSFNPRALRRVHQLLPNVPLGLLALPGYRGAWARSWLGRLMVPYQALHPEFSDTNVDVIRQQQVRDRRVHTWTVNSPEDMKRLFKAAVDGIFTDDPPLAQEIRAQVIP
jgi:glycerophosphoryl diester phosphodiesterase